MKLINWNGLIKNEAPVTAKIFEFQAAIFENLFDLDEEKVEEIKW